MAQTPSVSGNTPASLHRTLSYYKSQSKNKCTLVIIHYTLQPQKLHKRKSLHQGSTTLYQLNPQVLHMRSNIVFASRYWLGNFPMCVWMLESKCVDIHAMVSRSARIICRCKNSGITLAPLFSCMLLFTDIFTVRYSLALLAQNLTLKIYM